MKFRSIVKLPNHKRFNFSPRYYDPIKEELEQRISLIESDMKKGNSADVVKSRISNSFERRRRTEKKSSVLIRTALVAILLVLFYYLLF